MFANQYLERNKKPALIEDFPTQNLGMVIMIPCLQEPDILDTLRSLKDCLLPGKTVEVITVINHSENAPAEIKAFNNKSKEETEKWISENDSDVLKFYVAGPVELNKKWAGAGLARKTGMDEALRRFNLVEKPDGIIVSLDADTLVAKNYLVAIENHFKNFPKHAGATISFQHQTNNLKADHLEGILLYEKYMEYYKNAMQFSGYPWAMYTVGSAFAVTAGAYVKRGGMNRRKAGEDFYFLQHLSHIGTVGEITNSKVYPSARLSGRVPFGTGAVLQKWLRGEEDLSKAYDFQAFIGLKVFFDRKDKFYLVSEQNFSNLISDLPIPVIDFLKTDNFYEELNDLNRNCSSLHSFQNRFFQKFNAFKILKYLNFTHEKYFQKSDLQEQIALLHENSKS